MSLNLRVRHYLLKIHIWLLRRLIGQLSVVANIATGTDGRVYIGNGLVYNSSFRARLPDPQPGITQYCAIIGRTEAVTSISHCVFNA